MKLEKSHFDEYMLHQIGFEEDSGEVVFQWRSTRISRPLATSYDWQSEGERCSCLPIQERIKADCEYRWTPFPQLLRLVMARTTSVKTKVRAN